jgi:hypothetical protein
MSDAPHKRSLARVWTLYGLVLSLSLAALGLMWERFTWRVTHPVRVSYPWPIDERTTSGWPAAKPVTLVPSMQVVAFSGHLKSIPGLAALVDPIACTGSGKQPRRPRYCVYRAADIEVRVGYDRDHGELRSATFTRRFLNDTPPLPWSDLAQVIPWVCPLVSSAQAVAVAAQFAEAYPAKLWASRRGMTPDRPSDVGRRELRLDPHPQCHAVLVEQVDGDRIYSELYVLSVKPGPNARWVKTGELL